MDVDCHAPVYNARCRYESVFPLPIVESLRFKYINSDYHTYKNSPLEIGDYSVLKGLKDSLISVIFAVSTFALSIFHSFRIPVIGTDLSKFYLYTSVRCLQINIGIFVYVFNKPLGSYLIEEACVHAILYHDFFRQIRDQEFNFVNRNLHGFLY